MPVKVWEIGDRGLSSRVESDWAAPWTIEQYRGEAESLDAELDRVLDDSLARVDREAEKAVPAEFIRAWAVGRSLSESGAIESRAMRDEQPSILWTALASKCRAGARADGTVEERWRDLRPKRTAAPRREGGKLDYFEMCRWLSEQDLSDAVETFGGQVRNVWQMLERPTLRPLVVRQAFLAWYRQRSVEDRELLQERDVFAEAMKTLRQRWPDRGRGSAKRPVHYQEAELRAEIDQVLAGYPERSVHRDGHSKTGREAEQVRADG